MSWAVAKPCHMGISHPMCTKGKGSHPVQQLGHRYLSSCEMPSHPIPGPPLLFIMQVIDMRQLLVSMEWNIINMSLQP